MSSSRRGSARAAIFFGLLAILAIPVGIAISQYVKGAKLLQSLYIAVPVAAGLALIALAAARHARYVRARSVYSEGGRWPTRFAWAGIYAAATGGIALAVYGGLRAAQ